MDFRQSVRAKIEDIKHQLSADNVTEVTVRGLGKTRPVVLKSEFESLTKHLVDSTINLVKNVLDRCKITERDIDLVLLVGGSTMMPMIQNAI